MAEAPWLLPSETTTTTTKRPRPAAVASVCEKSSLLLVPTNAPVLEFTSAFVQPPAKQTGVLPAHFTPQLPQLAAVARSASQPLSGLPSQLLKPASQVATQSKGAEPLQPLAPCALLHALPHAAQF